VKGLRAHFGLVVAGSPTTTEVDGGSLDTTGPKAVAPHQTITVPAALVPARCT
jgi:hypothetical protein